MGLTLLERIQADKVYVINRGKNYWDNKSQKIMTSPKFTHIKQDRDKTSEFTKVISKIIETH